MSPHCPPSKALNAEGWWGRASAKAVGRAITSSAPPDGAQEAVRMPNDEGHAHAPSREPRAAPVGGRACLNPRVPSPAAGGGGGGGGIVLNVH